MADRFVVLDKESSKGVISEEDWDMCYSGGWADERSLLVDTKDGRILGTDGGEPEDNTLGRDWSWVAVELNKLAEEAGT